MSKTFARFLDFCETQAEIVMVPLRSGVDKSRGERRSNGPCKSVSEDAGVIALPPLTPFHPYLPHPFLSISLAPVLTLPVFLCGSSRVS